MNPDPPVSASQVLGLQACATTPSYFFIFKLFYFSVVLGIEPRGILPPNYTPVLFIFILKQSLTEAVLEPVILLSQPPK